MDGSYTVEISSNLVNRLTNDGNKPKKKTRKLKPKVPKEQHQPQSTMSPISSPSKSSTGGAWPLFLPTHIPPPPAPANAELEAVQSVLRDSERVLERLEKQETSMTQELSQRAKELRDKEFKLPYQKPMPCVTEKQACLDCYRKHNKEPLKCTQAVKAFADCARLIRRQATLIPSA